MAAKLSHCPSPVHQLIGAGSGSRPQSALLKQNWLRMLLPPGAKAILLSFLNFLFYVFCLSFLLLPSQKAST